MGLPRWGLPSLRPLWDGWRPYGRPLTSALVGGLRRPDRTGGGEVPTPVGRDLLRSAVDACPPRLLLDEPPFVVRCQPGHTPRVAGGPEGVLVEPARLGRTALGRSREPRIPTAQAAAAHFLHPSCPRKSRGVSSMPDSSGGLNRGPRSLSVRRGAPHAWGPRWRVPAPSRRRGRRTRTGPRPWLASSPRSLRSW